MSASDADPVLVATDPVISHEVPVPVDGQILKDVLNLGSNGTPESVAAGLVSLNKADASNGAVGPATSDDEKENAPSHGQPASVGDGIFADDKEVVIHGSDIALEKAKDVQDAPVVEVDNAASDSITTDNVDDTTSNEKDNEAKGVKDIPSTPEAENVATAKHGTPADSDLIAPVANTIEAKTIDDSANDSAIDIPTLVLEKKQGCAKDDEDDAALADGAKAVETGNHDEAVQLDERDTTDNVDGTPEIMNQAQNGEVALQENGNIVNVDVDIVSSATEGDAFDINAVPETKEENPSIAMAEAPESNATDCVVAHVDAADASVEPAAGMDNPSPDHDVESAATGPKAIVEDIVEPTQGENVPAVAEEQVPVVKAAATETDLKENGTAVATETEIAVESNDAEVTTEEVEQAGVDEISAEPMNNLDAKPLVEEVEVGHEVEPAAEVVNDIEKAGSHEEPVRSTEEEGSKVPEVAERVIEEIPNTGEDSVVAVDKITEAPEEPTNDTEASISTPVEVESVSSEANVASEAEVACEEGPEVEPVVANETIAKPVDEISTVPEEESIDAGAEVEAEGESVPASEEITVPADTSDAVHEAASVSVEEEAILTSAVITEPVIKSEDIETVTPETTNGEASAKVEVEPVTANEEVIAAPVDEPVTTEDVAEVETVGRDDVTQEAPGSVDPESILTSDEVTITVIEVAEEPVPAPIELSEQIFTTTVNVENEEIPVHALDTVVAAESAPVEVPVDVTVAAAEHDVTAVAATVVTEDDSEPPVPCEKLITPVPEAAIYQADDEATHEASAPAETESVAASGDITTPTTQVDEAAPPSVHAPDADNYTVADAQTHTEIPGEIALDTESTIAVAEDETVVEETPAPAAEIKDAPETTQEAPATPDTGSESSPPIVEAESAGTSQSVESVPQTDEGASVPIAPLAAEITPTAIAQEVIAEGEFAVDEEKEHQVTSGELQAVVTGVPAQDGEETPDAGKDSTEVALKDTSVELATSVEETPSTKALETEEEVKFEETTVIEIQQLQPLAENAQSSTNVLELAGKEAIDMGSADVSAPVTEEIIAVAGQSADAVEESTSAPVVEVKEIVPELRTSVISIETSLDTAPFTPVLDSGIAFKEQELVPSTLSSIAEEFKRPKSSWPSFQVSTVGGVESSGVDARLVPESTELTETGESASVSLLVVEDTSVNEQVRMIGASEDISADQPSSEQPPRPWTTSYSVHSQGIAENFSSIDEPVFTREPATVAPKLPLEEQGELAIIPMEESLISEQIIEDATSTIGSSTEEADQVSELAPADLTEHVSEEVTGGLENAIGEEYVNENVDQEANQEVEAKLTIDDTPARPWTPSYSTHLQGTPLIATKELEDVPQASDVALSAEGNVENHAEDAVTVDSEHDNTVDEQINTTENEAYDQLSTEVSHANPVIAFEGHKMEDETLNPQQSSQETNPNLENELPPRPWTPSYSVRSQGSPAAVLQEIEDAPPLDAESIEQSIPESTAATSLVIDEETTHSKPLTTEFDKGETPSSVEQYQNNISEIVTAAIAPAIALAALGAGIQGLVPVGDGEAEQIDATLTVDTTAVPLLSVPSEVVDGDATDTIADALEQPRSPWTPSYSVTKQGAGLSQEEEAEVDHLEPLPPAAATSDSEPQLNEVQEDDPASNALQTRPSYAVAGTEDIAKNDQFFLFGLRAIVAYFWVLPKWLSMTPSDHSREGSSSSSSSSSSKFFPGGWFTPKPNEGRTTLDVAQGEFASSPKGTSSNDVFETLGSEVTNSSAAINVAAEDDGQKRKWCVVM